MMLIGAPFCKVAEVVKNFFAIGVKNMWPVFMNQNTIAVIIIKRVAADMISLIYQQNFLTGF
jgi:hypothetical protein